MGKKNLSNEVLKAYNEALGMALLLCVDAFNAGKDAGEKAQKKMRSTLSETEKRIKALRDAKEGGKE